ncbi:MAG: CRISPR-associated protein Cas4 [bacterium]
MVAITSAGLLLTVRDLVEFVECPRIVYWSYLRAGTRHEQDPLSHQTAILYREKYDPVLTELLTHNGINEIDLKYNIHLQNKFIQGKIDILGRSLLKKYPIYIKQSKEIKSLQYFIPIYAYAWLIQDNFGLPVETAFIYYPNRKELEPVHIGKPELAAVEATAESARNVIVCGMLPDILHYNPRQCIGCSYRSFCNEQMR